MMAVARAKYKARFKCYLDGILYQPNDVFEFDGVPPTTNVIAQNDAAKKAIAARVAAKAEAKAKAEAEKKPAAV